MPRERGPYAALRGNVANRRRPGYYVVVVDDRGSRRLRGPYPTQERAQAAKRLIVEQGTGHPTGVVKVTANRRIV